MALRRKARKAKNAKAPSSKLTPTQQAVKAAVTAHNYCVLEASRSLGKHPNTVSRMLNHRSLATWWARVKAKKKRTGAQARRRRRYERDRARGKVAAPRQALVDAIEAMRVAGMPVEDYLPGSYRSS